MHFNILFELYNNDRSAGSHLARPAVGQRTFAVTMCVSHKINLHESSTYSVPTVVLDPVIGVKVETCSLASKSRGDKISTWDVNRR